MLQPSDVTCELFVEPLSGAPEQPCSARERKKSIGIEEMRSTGSQPFAYAMAIALGSAFSCIPLSVCRG